MPCPPVSRISVAFAAPPSPPASIIAPAANSACIALSITSWRARGACPTSSRIFTNTMYRIAVTPICGLPASLRRMRRPRFYSSVVDATRPVLWGPSPTVRSRGINHLDAMAVVDERDVHPDQEHGDQRHVHRADPEAVLARDAVVDL